MYRTNNSSNNEETLWGGWVLSINIRPMMMELVYKAFVTLTHLT